jgi:GTP-binding protein HflX
VRAADQVFATLDPTLREVRLPSGRRIILSDTVGFISELPTLLVAAFRATLEEVVEADLVLHVRDISHPETDAQRADVAAVLADLGIEADPDRADSHLIEVWNKVDRLALLPRAEIEQAARWRPDRPVLASAITGEGLDVLLGQIDDRLGAGDRVLAIVVPAAAGRLLHWLHEECQVLARTSEDDGTQAVRVRVPANKLTRLRAECDRAGVNAAE